MSIVVVYVEWVGNPMERKAASQSSESTVRRPTIIHSADW